MTFWRLLLGSQALLPLPVCHLLGTAMAHWAWLRSTKAKKVTLINLSLCFPDRSDADLRRLARQSLIETGKTIMEAGLVWSRSADASLEKIVRTDGIEKLDEGLKRGKGVIVFGPHMGNIEIQLTQVARRFESTIPYTPARWPDLDAIMRKKREREGVRMVVADRSGVRSMLETLRRGGLVSMAPDQVPRVGGVIAPFFGVPALTATILPSLARKTDAAVFSTCSIRLPRGAGFETQFTEVKQNIKLESPVDAAAEMNRALEECVMKAPAQYSWEYKRFRRRGPDLPTPYKPLKPRL
jgi:KDO2-lipid IV(A) lauroyltransferase